MSNSSAFRELSEQVCLRELSEQVCLGFEMSMEIGTSIDLLIHYRKGTYILLGTFFEISGSDIFMSLESI